MTALKDLIVQHIRAEGPLTIEHYMQLVLQHPDHGYYRKARAIGKEADFITAPEVSQMFGELVGFWCADVWLRAGKPAPFVLFEMGPGRGTLMADLLRVTAAVPGFRDAAQVYFLESNATLRDQQKEKLAGLCTPHWVDDIAALPALPTFVIANEFFDNLPIRQFERTPQGWCERVVAEKNGALRFALLPPDPALVLILNDAVDDPIGSVVEMSPLTESLAADVARHVMRHGGAGLLIDYGYSFRPHCGTLQANARHKLVSPLMQPGEVDVTAHVDFTRLAAALRHAGVAVQGPKTQGEFLDKLGIAARAEQLKKNVDDRLKKKIDADMKRLVSTDDMGNLFKVLAFRQPQWPPGEGFDG